MTEFTLNTEESTLEESKSQLAKEKNAYGMIVGMAAVLAEAPGHDHDGRKTRPAQHRFRGTPAQAGLLGRSHGLTDRLDGQHLL